MYTASNIKYYFSSNWVLSQFNIMCHKTRYISAAIERNNAQFHSAHEASAILEKRIRIEYTVASKHNKSRKRSAALVSAI